MERLEVFLEDDVEPFAPGPRRVLRHGADARSAYAAALVGRVDDDREEKRMA